MKSIFITFITLYQQLLSPLLKQLFGVSAICRYSPSCSEYAKHVIKKYGMIRGLKLALRRIISCQPWVKIYARTF
jgi:putative membrane protein insertion efficiency factor